MLGIREDKHLIYSIEPVLDIRGKTPPEPMHGIREDNSTEPMLGITEDNIV